MVVDDAGVAEIGGLVWRQSGGGGARKGAGRRRARWRRGVKARELRTGGWREEEHRLVSWRRMEEGR